MKSVYEANYKYDDRVRIIDAGDPALTDVHMYDSEWRAVYSNKQSDVCHLNAKGMEIMAENMLPLLKETLLAPTEEPEEEPEIAPVPEAPFASAEDCIAANTGNTYVLTGDDQPYFMGRWFEKEYDGVKHMVTLNDGSVIYFMVNGAETVELDFTVTTLNDVDLPYFSYSIDGSTPVRQLITDGVITLPDTGYHIVRIITDGLTEGVGKWDYERGFALKSITASDGGELIGVKPTDKTIFFYGDSITEGINALARGGKSEHNSVTAAYSWLTAEMLRSVPYIVGYGGSGIVKTGSFNNMENAVQYYSNNRPVNDGILPDVIIINHGHNDSKADTETFKATLLRTIALLKEKYPNAEIVYVIPFNQAKSVAIKSTLYSLYDEKIHIVETSNWVIEKTDGAHPSLAGATTAAENLSKELIEIFGKEFFGL
jgi:lysophospholipase L1-like esterase